LFLWLLLSLVELFDDEDSFDLVADDDVVVVVVVVELVDIKQLKTYREYNPEHDSKLV